MSCLAMLTIQILLSQSYNLSFFHVSCVFLPLLWFGPGHWSLPKLTKTWVCKEMRDTSRGCEVEGKPGEWTGVLE